MLVFILVKNPLMNKALEITLKNLGIQTYTLEKSDEAFFLLEDLKPQIVILEDVFFNRDEVLKLHLFKDSRWILIGEDQSGLTYEKRFKKPLEMDEISRYLQDCRDNLN
jgi:hypothetical protein